MATAGVGVVAGAERTSRSSVQAVLVFKRFLRIN